MASAWNGDNVLSACDQTTRTAVSAPVAVPAPVACASVAVPAPVACASVAVPAPVACASVAVPAPVAVPAFTSLHLARDTRAFTLAELLIVVAIIGVLVAIAIPTFSSQLEKAKAATCLSNQGSLQAVITGDYMVGTQSTLQAAFDADYDPDKYVCPDGGTYSLNDGVVTCSVHGKPGDGGSSFDAALSIWNGNGGYASAADNLARTQELQKAYKDAYGGWPSVTDSEKKLSNKVGADYVWKAVSTSGGSVVVCACQSDDTTQAKGTALIYYQGTYYKCMNSSGYTATEWVTDRGFDESYLGSGVKDASGNLWVAL